MKNVRWFQKIQNPLIKEWFKLASEDFQYAKSTFAETENYRMICFICQQVVERYLKGYLQFKQNKIPRIHDLTELLNISEKFNKNFVDFYPSCRILNRYYIDTRYPAHWGEIFKKSFAKEALECTEEIMKFIENQFIKLK